MESKKAAKAAFLNIGDKSRMITSLSNMSVLSEIEQPFCEALTRTETDVHYFIDQLFLLQFSIIGEPGYEIAGISAEDAMDLLAELFQKAYRRFEANPEFLFSIGYMIAVCDWCYKLDGLELSYAMLRRATDLEPTNPIYEWGYSFSTSQPNARVLSESLAKDSALLESLSAKGKCSAYLAEAIAGMPYFYSLPRGKAKPWWKLW